MPKRKLTHKLPCGAIATRTTAAAYTHVVVMRTDLCRRREVEARISSVDIDNYRYYAAIAATGVGGRHRLGNGLSVLVTASDHERAVGAIGDCQTAEQYAQHCADRRVTEHDTKYGSAEAGGWYVYSWASSEALAEKAASSQRNPAYCNRDIRVEAISG